MHYDILFNMAGGLKEWKKPKVTEASPKEMDELKQVGQELKTENKVTLTPKDKADIRDAIRQCTTPEERTELGKWLAEYFDVSIQTIAGIIAWKDEGSLTLKPQFEKPPPTPPRMEEVYDNPTKREWRAKVKRAIESDFTPDRLHDARVVCLPGQALQEVTEIYIPLGIQPQNIVCIEGNKDVANKMRASVKTLVQRKVLSQPVTIFEGTVEEFLKSEHEPVTIASFDFLGPVHKSFLEGLRDLRTADKFMLITNFLQRRERKEPQTELRTLTSVTREKIIKPILKPTEDVRHWSEFLMDSDNERDYLVHREDILTGRTTIELSDARDEGMVMTLIGAVRGGHIPRAFEELYSEVGSSPPALTPDQLFDFLAHSSQYMARSINEAFEKHPGLFKTLNPIREEDATGKVIRFSNTGRRGFLQNVYSIILDCFHNRMLFDVQRYEYSSERVGSPYQTDIFAEFDWRSSFKQENRKAFEFIRKYLRALGQHGKDAVSIRLETFGKKVLPQTYSGGAVGVTLALCIDGEPRDRVSLHNLQQLVNYYRAAANKLSKVREAELLARPRIEIKAP